MAAEGSTRVVVAALGANAGLAIAKFAASVFTGSSAMLCEAIHSLVATSNQALILHGLKRPDHAAGSCPTFDHANERRFWTLVVAILLFAMGAGASIHEGWGSLTNPHPITRSEINYVVLAIAIAIKGATTAFAARQVNVVKGDQDFFPALRASMDPSAFVILTQDVAAIAGLLVALAGIMIADIANIEQADGIASIVIGLILATVAAIAAIEVKYVLSRGPTMPIVQQDVKDIAAEDPEASDVPSAPPTTVAAEVHQHTVSPPHRDESDDTGQRDPPASDKPRIVTRPRHARKGRGKRRR